MILNNSFGRHLGFGSVRFRGFGAPSPMRPGSIGTGVMALQKALIDLSWEYAYYLTGKRDLHDMAATSAVRDTWLSSRMGLYKYADGIYGENTAWAVRQFQEGVMCSAVGGCGTGIADAATIAALGARSAFMREESARPPAEYTLPPPPPAPMPHADIPNLPSFPSMPGADPALPGGSVPYVPGAGGAAAGALPAKTPWGLIAGALAAAGAGAWFLFR